MNQSESAQSRGNEDGGSFTHDVTSHFTMLVRSSPEEVGSRMEAGCWTPMKEGSYDRALRRIITSHYGGRCDGRAATFT